MGPMPTAFASVDMKADRNIPELAYQSHPSPQAFARVLALKKSSNSVIYWTDTFSRNFYHMFNLSCILFPNYVPEMLCYPLQHFTIPL